MLNDTTGYYLNAGNDKGSKPPIKYSTDPSCETAVTTLMPVTTKPENGISLFDGSLTCIKRKPYNFFYFQFSFEWIFFSCFYRVFSNASFHNDRDFLFSVYSSNKFLHRVPYIFLDGGGSNFF
ncbi:hypothetical protein LY90DRAFT_511697 [Neocallimastix californiae]|uniref:Uncharacterized protein n=1 Tax=Neocallimastix californiae TaxID=1754190 RepID=A0A1Y2BKH5_9FUNG|nr:hypothetical protein LY90DRAFT_511697 [Neocallimastix californiae]|eukprot:ORY35273.1 hypothetical protein LY90DRAFT_511697 [Neocallimastix californiae]